MSLSLQSANLTPIGDRVLVKLAAAEEQQVGGIYIPDSAKEKPQTAEVVALGSGKKGWRGNRVPGESWRQRSHQQIWRNRSQNRRRASQSAS